MRYKNINQNELHLRISKNDYIALSKKAEIKGYSKAELCRKIIHEYLSSDEANNSLDIITLSLKDTLKTLDSKFFDIKDFNYKIYRANIINKFLIISLLENIAKLNPVEIKQLHDDANKKAFYYMSQNLSDMDTEEDIIEDTEDLEYIKKIFLDGKLNG